MIRDIWAGDLALIELNKSGTTAAPADVLRELKRRGHLTASGKLTIEGRRRARGLADAERNLRGMYARAAQGKSMLTTDGRGSLHIGGGRATIRS
jgi:hypothetical protein